MSKRARSHVSLRDKLAAALGHMMHEVDGKLVPRFSQAERASLTTDEMLALWEWDHNIPHAIGGSNEHWNLTPMPSGDHRRKTSRDVPAIAKSKRIEAKTAEFRTRLLAKTEVTDNAPEPTAKKGKLKGQGFRKPPAGTKHDWKTGRRVKINERD